jgi:competence protein ComEA
MHRNNSWRGLTAAVSLALLIMALCSATPCMARSSAGSEGRATNPVDINSADAEQLMTIPGIGKVMAERIIQFRNQHGPFKRVEDLLKIKGIGEKSFQKIRSYVKVGKSG